MRRKLALVSAAVALGALLVVGGTMAYFTGTDTVTNTINTNGGGDTGIAGNIQVIESDPETPGFLPEGVTYTAVAVKEGNKVTGINYTNLVPGVTIEKDPVVTYTGKESVYIRYKVELVEAKGVTMADLTFQDADGVTVTPMNPTGDNYVVTNGYVYDTTIHTGDKEYRLPLFSRVNFSNTLGNDFKSGKIVVTAEAIQSDEFTPDWEAEDPWNGVEATNN